MKKTKQKIKNAAAKAGQKANRPFELYTKTETKKKFLPSLAKTGVDLLAATAGGGVGAAFGYWSVAAGFLITGLGHFVGDKTGLIKTFGLSAMVYGAAKGYENSQAAAQNSMNGISIGSVTDGVKTRMIDFKDNLIHAFYLGNLIKDKEPSSGDPTEIGSVNLDELDIYDDFADQQIEQQALNEERRLEILNDVEPFEQEIDEEPDEDEEGDEDEYTEYEELKPEVIDFNAM